MVEWWLSLPPGVGLGLTLFSCMVAIWVTRFRSRASRRWVWIVFFVCLTVQVVSLVGIVISYAKP
jgi:hypothetical protein